MTTKSKKAKATPAAKAPRPSPAKATPTAPPEIEIIKSTQCPSLTQSGLLTYERGKDAEGKTQYRITGNNGGGFYSGEWVAWEQILEACSGTAVVTSLTLRGLFRGRSVNTAGFMLAALLKEGLLERSKVNSRHYQLTDAAHKQKRAL
jgi:hypothetical protein